MDLKNGLIDRAIPKGSLHQLENIGNLDLCDSLRPPAWGILQSRRSIEDDRGTECSRPASPLARLSKVMKREHILLALYRQAAAIPVKQPVQKNDL